MMRHRFWLGFAVFIAAGWLAMALRSRATDPTDAATTAVRQLSRSGPVTPGETDIGHSPLLVVGLVGLAIAVWIVTTNRIRTLSTPITHHEHR